MQRRLFTLAIAVAIVAGFQGVSAVPAAGSDLVWIGASADPATVIAAVETNSDKLPVEFFERLKYQGADGTIRVMVALSDRTREIERFVEANTKVLAWYGDAPRFYASIYQDDLVALLKASFVTFVEPDYPLTYFNTASMVDIKARSLTNDGTAIWSYDETNDSLASDVPGLTVDQATGKGVTVAITDSGIDKTHRDFDTWDCEPLPYQQCESRVLRAVAVDHIVGAGFDFGDEAPTTDYASGHGTHVAGTVAGNGHYIRTLGADPARYRGDGRPFGAAPQANLISTKNGDSQWAGLSSFGLQWQLDNAGAYGIRVSSNSWGCLGGCSFNGASATGQLFRDMYNAGIVVVFAAGNDGAGNNGSTFSGNAQSPYVLGVAAYDDANSQIASFSSRGVNGAPLYDPTTWIPESEPVNGTRRPDVAAPGVGIWSTRNLTGGTSSTVPRVSIADADMGSGPIVEYATMSGTSMSTPHVAGTAALLFSACPEARPLDVMRAVMAGADANKLTKTGNATVKAEPFEEGYGALIARGSLDWLMALPVCGGGTVNPNEAPTAVLSGPASATAGSTVSFDGTGSFDPDGSITSYSWDFGDGSDLASGAVVEHSFRDPGIYEVRLTVTDDRGVVGSTTTAIEVIETGSVAGTVTDFGNRKAIAGAVVDCTNGLTGTSDASGTYSITGLVPGTYTCTASASGYRPESVTVTVTQGQTAIANFSLRRGKP